MSSDEDIRRGWKLSAGDYSGENIATPKFANIPSKVNSVFNIVT
jgi:hypothetical protein